MRFSARRDDPDFLGEENFGRYDIELDGERVERVVVADEEAGYIEVHVRNASGRMYEDPQRPGYAATERKYGRVRIIDKRAPRIDILAINRSFSGG